MGESSNAGSGNDYRLITSVAGIREYIGDARVVAFDYETAPDDIYRAEDRAALDPHRSHPVGCSFSVAEHTGIYVPIAHQGTRNINGPAFWRFMKGFLESDKIVKVAHNIAFESKVSYHRGIVIQPPVYDTICASQLTLKNCYEFRRLSDSGLKKLAAELCGEPLPSFEDVTAGRHFDELDPEGYETVRYGCADSDFALRLYRIFNEWFRKLLPAHGRLAWMESETAVYLGIMNHNGVPVDIRSMMQRKREAEAEMDRLHGAIEKMTGGVNVGANCSTQAFKNYLFREKGLPVMKATEKGSPAADDQVMQMLKEWCDANQPEMSPLFEHVQEYRKWGKIKSTYIDGYLKHVNVVTGRIHPEMSALSTETGRMNCRNPNIQNCPRKTNDPIGVRSFIKAPEGKLILSLDYSQIELRVGSFYCRDKVMMDTYRNDGDIHAATTSVIFGVTYEEAQDKHRPDYKEQRTIAKNVNFGTFYGLFARGLRQTLKFKAGVDKTVPECQEILDSLKAGYPGLTRWQEAAKAMARRKKYTETWLGRRRYLPAIDDDDWGKRSFAERCALNTPIQGTAADILKLAIGRILKGLPDRPWLEPILQIHDELTFIIPKERLGDAVSFIRGCMEQKPFQEFDLPLVAEASAGPDFGHMEELDG